MKRGVFIVTLSFILMSTLAWRQNPYRPKPKPCPPPQSTSIDAGTLDGYNSSDFAFSSHTHIEEHRVIVVPAAAFQPDYAKNTDWNVSWEGSLINSGTYSGFVAPIDIPQNSRILSLTGHMGDNEPGPLDPSWMENVYIQIRENPFGTEDLYVLSQIGTSGAPGFVSTTSTSTIRQPIDIYNSHYWLYVFLASPNLSLQSVIIEYEVVQ